MDPLYMSLAVICKKNGTYYMIPIRIIHIRDPPETAGTPYCRRYRVPYFTEISAGQNPTIHNRIELPKEARHNNLFNVGRRVQ